MSKTNDEPKFGEAMNEIETILGEIDADDVDLDDLAAAVSRAADLIAVCKAKITHAETEVQRVFDAMNSEES